MPAHYISIGRAVIVKSTRLAAVFSLLIFDANVAASQTRQENCEKISNSFDRIAAVLIEQQKSARNMRHMMPYVEPNNRQSAEAAVQPFVRFESAREGFVAATSTFLNSIREYQSMYDACAKSP